MTTQNKETKMKYETMDMTISHPQGTEPITVLSLQGNLDRFSYLDLVNKSKEIYDGGHRSLVIDMSQVNTIGISGLYALYSTAMVFRGEEPLAAEGGWSAIRWMGNHLDGVCPGIKLAQLQPQIAKALSQTGLPICDDLPAALASFSN